MFDNVENFPEALKSQLTFVFTPVSSNMAAQWLQDFTYPFSISFASDGSTIQVAILHLQRQTFKIKLAVKHIMILGLL